MKKSRFIVLVVLLSIIIISLFVIILKMPSETESELREDTTLEQMKNDNPIVTMRFKNYGDVTFELYPEVAPNTVANFVNLVQDGFFDKNAITRVQHNFVIQAGGKKELNYAIKGEFSSNGFTNNLKHTRGVISMARSNDPNSASGQFFIMLGDAAYLDGNYAAFGRVIKGMDIIEKIENAQLRFQDQVYQFLTEDSFITISKAIVNTKNKTYKVEKIR